MYYIAFEIDMTASLTIIRYRKRYVFFAIIAMALFRLPLLFNKRSRFWKLMGSGKNGTFDKKPDWQQWGILSVSSFNFKTIQLKHFTSEVLLYKLYGTFIAKWINFFNCETVTYLLDPIEGHGLWDGKNPFGNLPNKSDYEGQIAVLTRATIRNTKLKRFWQHVNQVAIKMKDSNGFITSYGIGEIPWKKQATFSVWKNKESMKDFAYKMKEHQEIIKKTRQENWYSEDMFVRFKIDGCIGSLNGVNPLKGKL